VPPALAAGFEAFAFPPPLLQPMTAHNAQAAIGEPKRKCLPTTESEAKLSFSYHSDFAAATPQSLKRA
jgi:hypothetical protein